MSHRPIRERRGSTTSGPRSITGSVRSSPGRVEEERLGSNPEVNLKTLGNVLWLILCGIWMSIIYFIAGVVAMIFIITIPFGFQAFKMSNYVLWP
ncbi:MAG: YccF domain-containing protein, partial [Acidimicrobiia bacterium]